MARIFLQLFGCDKNRIDLEITAYKLLKAGYELVNDAYVADVAIVNTCSFIESATVESIDGIIRLVNIKQETSSSLKAIVVMGCMSQRYMNEISEELPEVDAFIGLGNNNDVVTIIEKVLNGKRVVVFSEKENLPLNGKRMLTTPKHYAYIKIAEGCSNYCSYCVIPFIRGRFRSRSMDEILTEAKDLVKRGVKELILIAQDTTNYGNDLDNGSSLALLLKEIVKIKDLWKVRLLYCYGEHITDELIDTIAREDKIAKYIDIPMQHASDDILIKMNRKSSKQQYTELISKLRARNIDIAIRSTFIVGFPTETDKDFFELLEFIKKERLARVGCFSYSKEDETAAGRMKKQIPIEIKNRRYDMFMTVQTTILSELQSAMISKEVEVIIDSYDKKKKLFYCRSEYDAPEIDTVIFLSSNKKLKQGDITSVRITKSDGIDLFAEDV